MKLYEFELIFSLPEAAGSADDIVDALFEAGCDDAVAGIGKRGRIALAFSREAANAEQAMTSGRKQVCKAVPGAELIEVKPDLVNLSEIAEILGYTRQNMQKYAANPGSTAFPSPVHSGAPDIWHLYDVLSWLREQKHVAVDEVLIETALAAAHLNAGEQSRRFEAASTGRRRAV